MPQAVILQFREVSVDCLDSLKPIDRDDKFDSSHNYTKSPNLTLAVLHVDNDKAGEILCVTLSTQFALPHECKGQSHIPNHSSLPGGSRMMVPKASDRTTNSNLLQFALSDIFPVHESPVPFVYNFTPEASPTPPDSKHGKTNLNVLKF